MNINTIIQSINVARQKRREKKEEKLTEWYNKEIQTPEYKESIRQAKLEKKGLKFMKGLDYFSASLKEYENMKDIKCKIIDLDNHGQEATLFLYGQDSLKYGHKDANGNIIKQSVYDIQGELIDRLIEEKCIGMIRCSHYDSCDSPRHDSIFEKAYFTYNYGYFYIRGYFIKEIVPLKQST